MIASIAWLSPETNGSDVLEVFAWKARVFRSQNKDTDDHRLEAGGFDSRLKARLKEDRTKTG